MTRLRSLDGLRALAMIAVIASHTAFPLAWGGWLGVDVFFVLSGFLITSLLLNEREKTGSIKVRSFYLRRAARLYPALVVVVVGGSAFAGIFGDSKHGYWLTAGLALTYTENLWMWATDGLGGSFAHMWSLAVEEQFYLLWPLALLVLRTRRAVIAAAGVGAITSFALMATDHAHIAAITQGYYLPHTRVWQILLGALLAAWQPAIHVDSRTAAQLQWAGFLGLAATLAVVGQVGTLDSQLPVAGECLTVSLCAVTLIAGLAAGTSAIRKILEIRPLQWLGRISYGAYLFHVPVMVLLTRWLPFPTTAIAILVFVVTVLLADLTYRWVEVPVRDVVRRRDKTSRGARHDLNALSPLEAVEANGRGQIKATLETSA